MPQTTRKTAAATEEVAPTTETLTERGIVGSLLDFTFESYLTPSIIKFLYLLSLGAVALSTLGWISPGGFTDFIWRLVFSPVVLVVGALLARVGVEIILVMFRILALLQKIEANQRNRGGK